MDPENYDHDSNRSTVRRNDAPHGTAMFGEITATTFFLDSDGDLLMKTSDALTHNAMWIPKNDGSPSMLTLMPSELVTPVYVELAATFRYA